MSAAGGPAAPSRAGWPHQDSPFHDGERQAQERAGVADKIESVGRRVIRTFMPEDHRELFGKLPLLFLGVVDDLGQPWASVASGAPGFVRTPDERTLHVSARLHAADPAAPWLRVGRAIGLLGLEAATRRRNRVNGELAQVDERGLTVRVTQSFGNCPQYIWARQPAQELDAAGPAVAQPLGPHLDAAARALIGAADTFFIATASAAAAAAARGHEANLAPSDGVDVSHRGGKPGFVAVHQGVDGVELCAPDYRGNFLFNTLGNLEQHPRAGLLFVDYHCGDMLSLTGEASVSWDAPELALLPGAQRLLRLRVTRAVRLPGARPWRWSAPTPAPQLAAP